MFWKGSTAIDGLSGSGNGIPVGAVLVGASLAFSAALVTRPTKRKPFRATVRINRCCSPLSPIAFRAALMLGDHALSILHEINQQIENLWLDGDLLGTSSKLLPVDIQGVVLK